jgi:hypothetical protein
MGKYKYKHLPMGVKIAMFLMPFLGIKIAPDIFQNVMSKLVHDMEYVKTYLDVRNGSRKTFNHWYESENLKI